MIERYIAQLILYGLERGILDARDEAYARNRLLSALRMDDYGESEADAEKLELEDILGALTDHAFSRNLFSPNNTSSRDLFDTELMGCLTPPPSAVAKEFFSLYAASPQNATDYFYRFSQDTDYIRRYRVKKDIKWKSATPYGEIDITINLSKPEKDPAEIAAAAGSATSRYPKCLLCRETEGYAGHAGMPARQNHRIIPIELGCEQWYFQYSPYVYYNEHCIALNEKHIPMKIDRSTFTKLADFVTLFPHYFMGSNADLPIVGGSILSHDHFQGGRYEFAMASAPIAEHFDVRNFSTVTSGIVKWPLSVIRLQSASSEDIVELADLILGKWRAYSDERAFIHAQTSGAMHNTITPIMRRRGGMFELDLALRNNITTDEHPLGVFHPHAKLHHIKKENIGLIEVMGLAVLPPRLKSELELLKEH
ncbi:MAG: UDP-glucose--hexose-1-phosphate uridylyltransferase, partial [Synergistaceae bacterium]|nr:UDP-glucose--hexose-1-phosphate uridylyltransferase [Synergistaceae bacterium]